MSRRTKVGLVIGLVVIVGVVVFGLAAARRGGRPVEVRLEPVARRDLVAVVTASGKVEAKTKVDISSDITGRITKIYVREGDRVRKGQLLIQIDPAQFQSIVDRTEASLQATEANMLQVKANLDQAKRALDRSLEIQRVNANLISRESVEQAQQAHDVALANYNSAKSQVDQGRAAVREARENLGKTRLYAPIGGRVTRLAVEEGEVAVPGTFSRETGLLMTVSDLSVILTKVDVDETDVVRLALGDSVAVSIDAFPDTTFVGRVTEISNSAKLAQVAGGATTDRAVDFEVEVTLQNPPEDIRPDLSATARIVTDTRKGSLSIPIIALTVREHEELPNELKTSSAAADTTKKKEREGVFIVRNGIAMFSPVRVGVAGEEFFELLEGLAEGDTVVAGPYQAIRDMKDSTRVKHQPDLREGTRTP